MILFCIFDTMDYFFSAKNYFPTLCQGNLTPFSQNNYNHFLTGAGVPHAIHAPWQAILQELKCVQIWKVELRVFFYNFPDKQDHDSQKCSFCNVNTNVFPFEIIIHQAFLTLQMISSKVLTPFVKYFSQTILSSYF